MYTEFKNLGLMSECIAAIFASVYFFKYRQTGLWLLLPLLWYIFINEILCQFLFARTSTGILLYNFYDIIVTGGVLYLISTQIKNKNKRQVILGLLILIIIWFFCSWLFVNPLKEFSTYNFMIFTITVVVGLLIYFVDLLQSNEVLQIERNLFLIVAFGFLIFFLSYPIITLARDFLSADNKANTYLNYIQFTVSITSYLTIAFGFYYGEKRDVTKLETV